MDSCFEKTPRNREFEEGITGEVTPPPVVCMWWVYNKYFCKVIDLKIIIISYLITTI